MGCRLGRHAKFLERKQRESFLGYILAADGMRILKQSCLKTKACTLNDSAQKTLFNAIWLFKVIASFNVICSNVDGKSLGTTYWYIITLVSFIWTLEKYSERKKQIAIFDGHTLIRCPLSSESPRISALAYLYMLTISSLYATFTLPIAWVYLHSNFSDGLGHNA